MNPYQKLMDNPLVKIGGPILRREFVNHFNNCNKCNQEYKANKIFKFDELCDRGKVLFRSASLLNDPLSIFNPLLFEHG